MASTSSECESETRLRALDPALPLLASEAAIELDTIIAGEEVNPTAVHRLAKILRNSLETPRETAPGSTGASAVSSERVSRGAGSVASGAIVQV